MKKTLLAVAILALASSAFACSNNQPCSVPSSTGTTVANAGSQTYTGANASSAGNGSAYSFNNATAGASATGFNTQGASTSGLVSVGGAHIGGQATTSGSVSSLSVTTGNAVANGYADTAACATVNATASYKVKGLQPISGNVSGSAISTTGFSVATGAGPGNGIAYATESGNTTSGFGANATSYRIGSALNTVNSNSNAFSVSSTAPAVNYVYGNAGAGVGGFIFAGTSGNAGANSNATSGNFCSTTSCVNNRGQ